MFKCTQRHLRMHLHEDVTLAAHVSEFLTYTAPHLHPAVDGLRHHHHLVGFAGHFKPLPATGLHVYATWNEEENKSSNDDNINLSDVQVWSPTASSRTAIRFSFHAGVKGLAKWRRYLKYFGMQSVDVVIGWQAGKQTYNETDVQTGGQYFFFNPQL